MSSLCLTLRNDSEDERTAKGGSGSHLASSQQREHIPPMMRCGMDSLGLAMLWAVGMVGCTLSASDRGVIGTPSTPSTGPAILSLSQQATSAVNGTATMPRRIGTLQFRNMRLEILSGHDGAGPRFAVASYDHDVATELTEDDLARQFPELYTVYRTARAGVLPVDARIAPEFAERTHSR